jgi:hypothetical protein
VPAFRPRPARCASVVAKSVVDRGRRDGRVTGRDGDLIEVVRDVSDRVGAGYRDLKVFVDDDLTGLVAGGSEEPRQFGPRLAAERRIECVEAKSLAARHRQADDRALLGANFGDPLVADDDSSMSSVSKVPSVKSVSAPV